MAEAFKDYFNVQLIEDVADIFSRVHANFDRRAFVRLAKSDLEKLELKERANQIMHALDVSLPQDAESFSAIISASMHPSEDPGKDDATFGPEGIMGFAAWPVTDLVTHRLLEAPELGLPLLKEVTKRFSAEFAIRPFLARYQLDTLKVLKSWLGDENRHVRRLVSEGTRPRLPWGMRLVEFVKDPKPILPLLEALRDDEDEYVRRSVANNLNDIAKDHQGLVADLATAWLQDASPERQRLVRHACRTLLKQGDMKTMEAFGYLPAGSLECQLEIKTPTVNYGEALEFSLDIEGIAPGGKLMVDYAIHFKKANGKHAPKVFKWKDLQPAKGSLSADRKHAIRPITTRKYYAGEHLLELFINGQSVAQGRFDLQM